MLCALCGGWACNLLSTLVLCSVCSVWGMGLEELRMLMTNIALCVCVGGGGGGGGSLQPLIHIM